jgi:hypothetical protein
LIWSLILPLAGILPGSARADDKKATETVTFGNLRSVLPQEAQHLALDWLKGIGPVDATTQKTFDVIWAQSDRSVLDRVAATFALGDPEAARLLTQAQDPNEPAPTSVPALFQNEKKPAFFRANLGLAYARALATRRVYEECLDALRVIKPEQVVEPAVFFFERAVAEYALGMKREASRSIVGLLEDVADSPQRYRIVALLMYQDMQNWQDKDLGNIARKMDNIERRLELSRGGPQTQKLQREVVARLDELIKMLEQPRDNPNGGACPNGGPGGSSGGQGNPMQDSNIATNSGPGNVDAKKLKGLAQEWGKLPDKERAKAMQDLIHGMPPRQRELIENYFKKLAQSPPAQP